jgi:hypothetical protein
LPERLRRLLCCLRPQTPFRNDMLQNQQRKPAYQPYLQAAPAPVEEKPKRSQRKRKAD